TIVMDNEDNRITLSKNKDTILMENFRIKTADQDVISSEEPLRWYIYKEATIEAEKDEEFAPAEPVRAPELVVEPIPAAEEVFVAELPAAEDFIEGQFVNGDRTM
ncbi:MAG: hypothetical protein ACP5EL_05595, partial [Methanocrinis sp.]